MEIEVKPDLELRLKRRKVIQRAMEATQALPFEGVVIGDFLVRQVTAEHCPVKHHFAPGQYAREMFLPAGTRAIGKVHKHAHITIVSKGRGLIYTEHDGADTFEAPCTFVSEPGTQRVVEILEDTVLTTVHVTDKTDLAEIEREIIATDYPED